MKKHLGEIVINIEIMIIEGVILLRIEHFEQGCRGIAAKIDTHLVDFIQAEHRIDNTSLLHRQDDLTRHGADIGATVTSNLGLVTDAAQRQADKLTAHGAGDRPAHRGLTHTWWPDQTENRPANFLHLGLHRQIFEDPLLGFSRP
jgi:hypothetical protein